MASKIRIATRMELLRLRKKVLLAVKGHKLLKQKRDALVSEFFKLIDEVKSIRKEMEEKIKTAFRSLVLAQAVSGIQAVEIAASSTMQVVKIESSTKSIMGVKVPIFRFDREKANLSERGYSILSTPLELDRAAENFEGVVGIIIKLAGVESTAKKLAEEIKKTKRKVNALERILIPKINGDIAYIRMRLEEMERENFSRLKVIKKVIT